MIFRLSSLMSKLTFLLIVVFISPCPLFSKNLTGTLYEISPEPQKALYRWEMTLTPKGLPWKSVYKTLDGVVVARDEVIWHGDSFQGYRYERTTINDQGVVTVDKQTVHFLHTMNGKQKKSKETLVGNFTTGPMVIVYILDHWEELLQGEEQAIRYGVIDQTSSFGFVLSHDTNHVKNGSGYVVFKMDADSFLIGFFVDPIYFIFREKNREMTGMIGRMLPVGVNEDGAYPINAELVISR